MKALLFLSIFFSAILISCDKNEMNPTIEEFCSSAPDGWEYEIFRENFDRRNIPQNADTPAVIIKFINIDRQFSYFMGNAEVHPSLILNFYSIKQKKELISFIKSQQMYSWCIPLYYGETKDYFIITSPCFINGGSFTDEANSCIQDLHDALKRFIVINDYGLITN